MDSRATSIRCFVPRKGDRAVERLRSFGFNELMGFLEKLLIGVASLALLVLTLLTTADALGRHFFNSPIPGTGEIIEDYFMIALIFLPLSYSFMQEGHVHVSMIERFFPTRLKFVVSKFNLLLSFRPLCPHRACWLEGLRRGLADQRDLHKLRRLSHVAMLRHGSHRLRPFVPADPAGVLRAVRKKSTSRHRIVDRVA